jgi:glutamate-ammonia-ligase adenylyltransferase
MQFSVEKIQDLVKNLPDSEGAFRFFSQLAEAKPSEANKLLKEQNKGWLSDLLAIAAWSPFLATTILQHTDYIAWLGRKRKETQIPSNEDLLESLGRYALTNSQLETHVLLSRFRRRELLRIYLRDIRGLATIAEITEDLSNLADTVLEYALRIAKQELDNRFGIPLEVDEKGRAAQAQFCIVSLGKLGSRELNYASDIDLLFLFSNDGSTAGTGNRHSITNREYFVKLAEKVSKIVGSQSHEGAAYRVDLRLRPFGSVGALAVSLTEAEKYYKKTARDWERQVLIRSRCSGGDPEVFRKFINNLKYEIYKPNETVENALKNVRLSKQKINEELKTEKGINIKLGDGGIREIEFIAQALQLAFGGRDEWLQVSHTLIGLNRLSDRNHLSKSELTMLADAYKFLRKLEHRLQMEHGLQTHLLPENDELRLIIAKRMDCVDLKDFDKNVKFHTQNVYRVFQRVFSEFDTANDINTKSNRENENFSLQTNGNLIEINDVKTTDKETNETVIFPEINPNEFKEQLLEAVKLAKNYHDELGFLRQTWREIYEKIHFLDIHEKISITQSKKAQTVLAEAALEAALLIARRKVLQKYDETNPAKDLHLGVLSLGKLGSAGMDYGSDLDLILVYDGQTDLPVKNLTHTEFYSRIVEVLVNSLSSLTREGLLYRVDLRLRPDGKNGATSIPSETFLNYLENRAAIWEWLAYVKLRGAAGDLKLAKDIENKARLIIHEKAQNVNPNELKTETLRVRVKLEREKTKKLRRGEFDLKYSSGGLLDIYFAVRYLQLRDNVPDIEENRSTKLTLRRLYEAKSLTTDNYHKFRDGYDFLRKLDHNLRKIYGHSQFLPMFSHPFLSTITEKMKFSTENELIQNIVFNSAIIRQTFGNLLK